MRLGFASFDAILTRKGLVERAPRFPRLTPRTLVRAMRALGVRDLPVQLVLPGALVELEHTPDPLVAVKIAVDHLHERRDYYDLLQLVEG